MQYQVAPFLERYLNPPRSSFESRHSAPSVGHGRCALGLESHILRNVLGEQAGFAWDDDEGGIVRASCLPCLEGQRLKERGPFQRPA